MIKKIAKWLIYSLLFLLILLGIAYWSSPYWLPSQVKSFLPANIKINDLELARPNFSSTKLEKAVLTIEGEKQLHIALEDVTLHYSLMQSKLQRIVAKKAQVTINSQANQTDPIFSNKIPLPVLPLEQIEIQQLTVSGVFIQELIFEQLRLNQSDNHLTMNSSLRLLGFDLNLSASAIRDNGQLKKIETIIKQQQDEVVLKLAPMQDNEKGFTWALKGSIDSKNYLPIAGLQQFLFNMTGDFIKQEKALLSLNLGSIITTDFNLIEFNNEQPFSEKLINTLKEKGFALNLDKLTETAKITSEFAEESQFEFSPDDSQIRLVAGSLPITISHPLASIETSLKKLSLNPSLELSAVEQHLAGTLQLQSQLTNLTYKQDNQTTSTNKLKLELIAPFTIQKSQLGLEQGQIKLSHSPVYLLTPKLKTTIKDNNWQGQLKIVQSLIGDDKQNYFRAELKNNHSINSEILVSNEANKETLSLKGLTSTIVAEKEHTFVNYQLNNLTLQEQPLNLSNIKGNAKLNHGTDLLQGKFNFSNLSYINEQVSIEDVKGKANWKKTKHHFLTDGQLSSNGGKIPFNYKINLNKEQHNLSLVPLNIQANTVAQWLTPILNQWPALTIDQGSITSPKITGDPFDLAFNGNLKLRDLNLSYDQLKIRNLQFDDKLLAKPNFSGKLNARIQTIEVATGINLTELKFSVQHSLDALIIQNLRGKILDGTLLIDNLAIAPEKPIDFIAQLKRIDLGKLLKALESSSLEVDGSFNFNLPISIDEVGQSINQGTFNNIDSGLLKVDTGPSAETNIAFQALQNFHYQQLSGTINYKDDGVYQLAVFLAGSNPDLYDGFPIELNLKIEGNLPNLLYSMLISGDMAKPIIDQYQSGDLKLPEQTKSSDEPTL